MFRSLFRFSWDKRYKKTRTSRKKSMKDKRVVTQVKRVSTSMKIEVYKVAQISPSYAFSFLTNLVLFLVLKSTKLTILRIMTDKAGSNLLWQHFTWLHIPKLNHVFENWTNLIRKQRILVTSSVTACDVSFCVTMFFLWEILLQIETTPINVKRRNQNKESLNSFIVSSGASNYLWPNYSYF